MGIRAWFKRLRGNDKPPPPPPMTTKDRQDRQAKQRQKDGDKFTL